MDPRIELLAKNLINYSCALKKGQKLLIEATGIDYEMVLALVRECYKAGAYPFVEIYDAKIRRELLLGMDENLARSMAKYDAKRMAEMHAYIGLRGGSNSLELSDVPPEKMKLYSSLYAHPVHHELRVNKTNWVVLRWPTEAMAQQAKMSTDAFRKFYFDVCNLDYGKMDRAMTPLVELMRRTDKVRIVAKDTDLSFSIKGIGAVKCSGRHNIPDGEVYTAPVRNSVNGYITYNTPSIENGLEFKDVRFVFENGKITNACANYQNQLDCILNTDEGARYVGEFALGVNPYITKPMGDILFDEKITGSIHFTPGSCYEDCNNFNKSAIHWDLVQIHTPEYGGGEIYFDGRLIRKDGRFVVPELYCLNPEALI